MKRAQTVVQAVVRTRPSLGLAGWSCMGARRRTVASRPSVNTNDGLTAVLDEVVGKKELPLSDQIGMESEDLNLPSVVHSSGHGSTFEIYEDVSFPNVVHSSGHQTGSSCLGGDDDDEVDELHIGGNVDGRDVLTDEDLLQRLEQELDLQRELSMSDRQEEEEVAKRLTQEEEEKVAAKTAEAGGNCIVVNDRAQGRELNRFFPPGRIIHLLAFTSERSSGDDVDISSGSTSQQEVPEQRVSRVGLYLTDRALYGKVRLSRSMINDHYMPNYRTTMEEVVRDLEMDE
ncbi:hypothetical protein KP509_1Z013200 [Ceratopteris richardii]|nr:hypothetical protein KP509_1Z013200 [Ceratopteris richardii]